MLKKIALNYLKLEKATTKKMSLNRKRFKASMEIDFLKVIDKWFPSSKLCNICGSVNNALTLSERVWTCSCGTVLDRDINAAINIKNEGCRMLGIA